MDDEEIEYVRQSLGISDCRRKIYISGAIMYADSKVDLFADAEARLEADGWSPLNPKSVDACPDDSCERQAHEIDKGMEHSWGCFLRYDLKALLDCDAIYMLPGWEQSHGARLELQVASAVGLKVMFA